MASLCHCIPGGKYGLSGVLDGIGEAVVSLSQAPESRRASTLGAYQMTMGICALCVSVLAGTSGMYTMTAPFAFSIGISAVSAVAALFFR